MTKRIRIKNGARTARVTSRAPAKVDAATVAQRLVAKPPAERGAREAEPGDRDATQPTLPSLRRDIAAALRSSGGRPGLEGAQRRQKIPMADADWRELEQLASALQAGGLNATAGQVAGQLLHDAIARLKRGPAYTPRPDTVLLRTAESVSLTRRKPLPTSPPASRVTYLVGAGINRGLRDGPERELPLAKDFFKYVFRQPRFTTETTRRSLKPLWEFIAAYWHLSEDHLKNEDFDFEDCFTLIEFERRSALRVRDAERLRHLSAIESLLAGLLRECLTGGQEYAYSEVHQGLAKRIYQERADVLTFNYDTVLESAIAAASPFVPELDPTRPASIDEFAHLPPLHLDREWNPLLAYKVHFDELVVRPGAPAPMPGDDYYRPLRERESMHPAFLKLHGSVEWTYRSGVSTTGQPIERGRRPLCSRFGAAYQPFDAPHVSAEGEYLLPLLITPVLDKPVGELELFRSLWEKAREVLQRTTTLVVAGYSFPVSDFHVKALFLEAFESHSLEQLCVVNPDTNVVSRVRALCNFQKPVVVCRNLDEYLRQTA